MFLKTVDVCHRYDSSQTVLQDINLAVPSGAFVSIIGRSGSGKSTLIRLLAGLISPSSGQVLLNGESAEKTAVRIGFVFQRDALLPWRTVYENVRLPLEMVGDVDDQRIRETIDLVGLNGVEESYPAQLSGGMAQRVAIARALIHQPSLLLLDEPFGQLDALTRERMGQELLRIRRANPVTVVMVTHSITEAVLLSDDVLVLHDLPATITHELPIELERPRMLGMVGSSMFQTYANELRDAL